MVEYHAAELWVERAQVWETPMPDIDGSTCMLVMSSIAYNADQRLAFLSLSAYPDQSVRFTLLRRRSFLGWAPHCAEEQPAVSWDGQPRPHASPSLRGTI